MWVAVLGFRPEDVYLPHYFIDRRIYDLAIVCTGLIRHRIRIQGGSIRPAQIS